MKQAREQLVAAVLLGEAEDGATVGLVRVLLVGIREVVRIHLDDLAVVVIDHAV